jgi:uncharacterized membrane protein
MADANLPIGTKIVVGSFITSGVIHMVKPDVFQQLVPPQLGPARPWVYGSGVLELVCAAGLVTRQTWAPIATAGALAGVWVGNVYLAVVWQGSSKTTSAQKVIAWARLPLQLPLIRWALKSPTRQALDG